LYLEELKKEPVTAVLVIVNLLVFLLVELTGGSQDVGHMLDWGAGYTPYILEQGESYRLFTSMFLHFGMEHLLNNMLVLFVLGQRLEPILGHIRFLLIYLLGGMAGNVVSLIMDMRGQNYAVSAGASGAVFALMGAILYVLIRNRGRVADLTARKILVMTGFSVYLGFASSGVDNAAHLGGMLGGFLLALLLYHPRKIRKQVP
jgi:rhomboid protease GluP